MQRDHLGKRCPSSLLLPAFVRVALVVPMPAPRLCNALVLMHDQLLPHPFQCLDDSFPNMSDLSKAELLHSMQPNADLEETCHLHETMVASAASTATNIHEFGLYAVHISYVLRRIVLHRAASKEWLYRGYGQHVPLESNANAWQESFESWRNTVMEAVLPSALSRECHPLVQRTCDFYPYLLPSVLQWTSDMQARGEAKDDSATVLQPLLDKVTSLLLSCKMPFPRLVEHERLLQQHVKALLVALAQQQVTEWAQLLKAHADLRELVETGFDDDGVAGVYLLPGYEHPPQQLCDDNIPPCQTLPALAALAHQQVRLSRRKA
ncbi:hypothetical protein DYB32_001322 [Aphanomyces invadans]|uniref:Uncharacterized protein n=1 Tax=Aphanomyces invadans TaxID=157072 RepID=A0A3R6YF37_9STRA|nr:hypothetical protein DYB32_001322 [Aphanomyces invadans]